MDYVFWVVVFASNMIVPLLFGSSAVREWGILGLWVAVFVLFCLGTYFCHATGKYGSVLVRGAVAVAFSQFFPSIQFAAGLVAITITNLVPATQGGETGFLRGFLLTSITGGILMTVSLGFGLLIRWFLSFWDKPAKAFG